MILKLKFTIALGWIQAFLPEILINSKFHFLKFY